MTKKREITIILTLILLLCPFVANAKPTIGIATPQKEYVTIVGFPFHYEDKFRVYNNGDEPAIYIIKTLAPYNDVLDWVNVNTSIFVLEPQTSKQITFTIDAEEGYTGNYPIIFKPYFIPEYSEESVGKIKAYIKLSSVFKFNIFVPEEVGDTSLGERPFLEDETLKEKKADLTRIVTDTEKSVGGVEFVPLTHPTILNMPDKVYLGELTKIVLSVIGGKMPIELKLLIVSPSGKRYSQPPTTEFRFNEVGKWSVLAVLADKVIFGKIVDVKVKSKASISRRTLVVVIEILVIAALLLFILRARKIKKKEKYHGY